MAFKNELGWSSSRDRAFDHCKRAYAYRYYLSWGGWQTDDIDHKNMWMCKRLDSPPSWQGRELHTSMQDTFEHFKETGKLIPLGNLIQQAKERIYAFWDNSESGAWKGIKKAQAMRGHFHSDAVYSPGLPMRTWLNVSQRLLSFYESTLASKLTKSEVVAVEALDSFRLDGTRIWASPDLLVRDQDKVLWALDWKTGKPRDSDRTQATAYAAYCHIARKERLDNIRSTLVYCNAEDVQTEDVQVTMSDLRAFGLFVRGRIAAMREFAPNDNALHVLPEPQHEPDSWQCESCNFKQHCRPETP